MFSTNMCLSKKMTSSRKMGILKKESWIVFEGRMAVSQGLDDTESLGKDSHSSEEVEKNHDQRKRFASTKEQFEKKSSSSSNKQCDSSKRRSRRGGSKQLGRLSKAKSWV